MKTKKLSAVIQLLDLVYGNACAATSHSWERINHAMRGGLELAVGSGMKFDAGDMRHVFTNYKSGYWIGESSEWVYSLAISCENTSAYQSYEATKGREPFLADDVRILDRSGFTHGNYLSRQRERLNVGAVFAWKGLELTVTSFADDSSYVNACSYKSRVKGSYAHKIDKRFKITRAELLTERSERKERKQLLDQLTKSAEASGNGMAEKIARALGARNRSDYARLPIEKIRKVAEKFTGAST